jgi:hypothetical protein
MNALILKLHENKLHLIKLIIAYLCFFTFSKFFFISYKMLENTFIGNSPEIAAGLISITGILIISSLIFGILKNDSFAMFDNLPLGLASALAIILLLFFSFFLTIPFFFIGKMIYFETLTNTLFATFLPPAFIVHFYAFSVFAYSKNTLKYKSELKVFLYKLSIIYTISNQAFTSNLDKNS